MFKNTKISQLKALCASNLFILVMITAMISSMQAQNASSFSTDIHLNSRGFGLQFNYITLKSDVFSTKVVAQLSSLKDAKEITVTNLNLSNPNINNGGYEFGKINSIYALRLGLGFEKTLAPRPDKNAVGVRYSGSSGVHLSVQSPTFIDYYTPGLNERSFVTERYDPEIHEGQNIIQSRGYFYGLSGAKTLPGLFLDQSLVFEFGNYAYAPNRITTGVLIDALFLRPELLYSRAHPSVFLTFYVSFAILNIDV